MSERAMFSNTQVTTSRIIYTPSAFARTSLVHLQEIGTLTANRPHTSRRSGLRSYLFFCIVNGSGMLTYQGKAISLTAGDCVFIDCQNEYAQCSGDDLWTLKWVHFYGNSIAQIYAKYIERGGQNVFKATQDYTGILDDIYDIAVSESYIRDMELAEKLSVLLTMLMRETITESLSPQCRSRLKEDISAVKSYLDEHVTEKITLDALQTQFFINKHYLNRIFKLRYGTTIMSYILNEKVTLAKSLLRFTDKSIEQIGYACGFENSNYFTRCFKKIEGITPREYRRNW